jgi:hypothetical protein
MPGPLPWESSRAALRPGTYLAYDETGSGESGASGAYLSADPENHLTIFYAQHVFGYADTYTVIHPNLRDLVYEALAGEL